MTPEKFWLLYNQKTQYLKICYSIFFFQKKSKVSFLASDPEVIQCCLAI